MGKNSTKQRKQTKAARRRAARRRRMLGRVTGYVCVIVFCVVFLVVLSRLSRPAEPQNQWVIEDGIMEIAAPPAEESAVTAVGGSASQTLEIDTIPRGHAADGEAPEEPEDDEAEEADVPASVGSAEAMSAHAEDDALETLPLPVQEEVPAEPEAPAEPVSITITAAGDCTLGGSVHQDTYARFKKVVQAYGYDYFFANVRQVFERDDLTIVNLEGALTDVGDPRHGSYVFKGDPDYVQIMTGSSVELCNVANNHSQDFGMDGLMRTAEVLEGAGIGCCGYTKVYRATINGVRVSALGYLEWEIDKQKIVDAVQAERPNCDLLIVNMHWGREKHYEPVAAQKSYGHAIIDAGADLIIGTHPHVYGGVEQYNGKYIVYSLGNFCFGGNANPSDKRCLMFQQTFLFSPGGGLSDGGINIIPCTISSVSSRNDYRPTIMGAEDGVKLLKAMSRYSNISGAGTKWMANSYPEQVGLIAPSVAGAVKG